jgi:hypothetical protein
MAVTLLYIILGLLFAIGVLNVLICIANYRDHLFIEKFKKSLMQQQRPLIQKKVIPYGYRIKR